MRGECNTDLEAVLGHGGHLQLSLRWWRGLNDDRNNLTDLAANNARAIGLNGDIVIDVDER